MKNEKIKLVNCGAIEPANFMFVYFRNEKYASKYAANF